MRRQRAATTIQAYFRRHAAVKAYRQRLAATDIQRVWRGANVRGNLAAFQRQARYERYMFRRAAAVTQIARMWRGVLGREAAVRERSARSIQAQWRGCHARRMYRRFLAIICLQRWWRAMLVVKLVRQVEAEGGGADNGWSRAPAGLGRTKEVLIDMDRLWLAKVYRDGCTPEFIRRMGPRVAASDIFLGNKASYPASLGLDFRGDHCGLTSDHPERSTRVAALFVDNGDHEIRYTDFVSKVNRSFKIDHNAVVLTDATLYRTDAKKFKVKEGRALADLTDVTLSPLSDSFVVVHSATYGLGDLLCECESAIEFVVALRGLLPDLPVIFADNCEFRTSKGAVHTLQWAPVAADDNGGAPSLHKDSKLVGTIFAPEP